MNTDALHRLAQRTQSTVVVTARPWPGEVPATQYEVTALVGVKSVRASATDLARALAECEAAVAERLTR